MKKIIYAILGIFMMAACTDDHLEDMPVQPEKETAGTVKLNFSVQIPEAKEAASRSFTAPAINTLYLAVFDGNGYLSYVAEATRTDGEKRLGTADSPIPFTVELSQTPNKRIIHFLANTTIDANDFGTENELIGALYTTDKQDAYWQRVELDNGVQFEYTDANNNKQYDSGEAITANTIGTKFTAVPLIRNFAKITIKTADGITTAGDVDFTLEGFTVVNVPDRGSVAPFNTNKGSFTQYVDTNKDAYSYSDLTGSTINYTGFIPNTTAINGYVAQDKDNEKDRFLSSDGVFYMYERNNQAKNANRTFVIVKGKFGNEASSYYKIDIAAKNGNVMRYFDILRNFSYNIVITNVESSGAASPDLAAGMTGSHNNLSAAVETQSLLNISDGAERLFVNYTEYVFVGTGETMQLKYRYVPDISTPNTEDNDIATYSWDNEKQSVASITPIASATDDAQGWRALDVTAATIDPNEVKSQILTLSAGNLSRTVNFILRAKYNFSNENATSPQQESNSDSYLKAAFRYSFTIPQNIPESLFPLTFVVQGSPENIYPNSSLNSLPVKVIDGEKTFGYEREVTYEEYQQAGGIINCYFRVNTENYNGTKITVSNRYFNDSDEVTLREGTKISIVDNDTNKDGELVWYVGETSSSQTATVTISNTDVAWTLNKLTNFNVTQSNNQLTITPKSMNNEVEETLTVTTADGMTDELVLKVVNKPTNITVTKSLKITRQSMGGNTNVTSNLTITSNNNNVTITNKQYSQDGNWTFDITYKEGESATITFVTSNNGWEYTSSMTLDNLLNSNTTSIRLTYNF